VDHRSRAGVTLQPFASAPPQTANSLTPAELVEIADPFRKLAFYCACLLLFTRVSLLNQIVSVQLHFNPYLLYLVGVPTVIGILVGGGLGRALRARSTYFWVAFVLWMGAGLPFSSWRAASLSFYLGYLRSDFIMLFAIGGLVTTWRECRLMMWSVAWGAVANLLSAQLFRSTYEESRVMLDFGTIANPNDYAAHLLFALPFLLWVALGSKSFILRAPAILAVGFGGYLVLGTASRGATIALAIDILLFTYLATALQRFVVALVLPLGVVAMLAILPHNTLQRIGTMSESEGGSEEAMESSRARAYVLRKSLEYTLSFPVFGVGVARFPSYEGVHNKTIGDHGAWLQTHNAYTQVSSECGIPAFLLYLGGMVATVRLLLRTYRQARARPECRDIAGVCLCLALAMAGFCTAALFLSLAYTFYLPTIAGLAIGIARAADAEFRIRPQNPPPPSFVPAAGFGARAGYGGRALPVRGTSG
jgi:O-antigen ligase